MTAQSYTDPAAVSAMDAMRHSALDREILDALARATAPLDATQIADMTGLCRESIQHALHRLDDDGAVLMRIGRYRLSEAERKRRGRKAAVEEISRLGQEMDAAQEAGA